MCPKVQKEQRRKLQKVTKHTRILQHTQTHEHIVHVIKLSNTTAFSFCTVLAHAGVIESTTFENSHVPLLILIYIAVDIYILENM